MPENRDLEIWLAFRSYLDAMPDVPFYATPLETFDPPVIGGLPQPYFIMTDVRFDNVRRFIDHADGNWRTGVMNIAVMTPVTWNYEQSLQYAGRIAEYFIEDTRLDYGDARLRVGKTPQVVNNSYRDGGMNRTPVNVFWEGI